MTKDTDIEFDGANRIIRIKTDDHVSKEELYSIWKRWVMKNGNARYLQAFQMTADTIIVINGWQILYNE